MHPFYQWLNKQAAARNLLVLALFYPLFPAVLLPHVFGDSSLVPLDITFLYSPDDVYRLFTAMGETLRNRYVWGALTVDLVYPLYYSFFASLVISFLASKRYSATAWQQHLRLLPFIMMALDFAENSQIVHMLYVFPARMDGIASLTNVLTLGKWAFAIPVLVAIIYLFLSWKLNKPTACPVDEK